MEQMSQGPRDAERQKEQADRIRRQAEEMLKQASPQEREQMERWARSMQGERGTPPPSIAPPPSDFSNEPVDARRPAADQPRERAVAQWFADQPPDRGAAPGRAAMDEQLRRAAEGAERAIEQQSVPGRYSDLVRRVFRRYEERAVSGPPARKPEAP